MTYADAGTVKRNDQRGVDSTKSKEPHSSDSQTVPRQWRPLTYLLNVSNSNCPSVPDADWPISPVRANAGDPALTWVAHAEAPRLYYQIVAEV